MKTITSTKEHMELLSQEQLTQAAFGTLCQAFALRLLERAGYEDGLYQQVALEFLDEGKESSQPVQNVFHIDLQIVLESLRREAEENKREKKATEKLLTQILQLQQQAPNDAKAPAARAEQRPLSLELYPTTIWQQTVYAQALLQNSAAQPSVSVETMRLADRQVQRSNTSAAGSVDCDFVTQTPTQALLAWRRSHLQGEETSGQRGPFLQRTWRPDGAASVVSTLTRHNLEQASDAQTSDAEQSFAAERVKNILPEALIHRTEQEAAGKQRAASDNQQLAQAISDVVDRLVQRHQVETGQDANSATEQPNAHGQGARKDARSAGQEETSNFSDRLQSGPGISRMGRRGGMPVGRDISITKPSSDNAQDEKPEAFAERVPLFRPVPERLEFLVQNTESVPGAGENRSSAHPDARKPTESETEPWATGQGASPTESNIPSANRDVRVIHNPIKPDETGRDARPTGKETLAQNSEALALQTDKESKQMTDTDAVYTAVRGNDYIENSSPAGVQIAGKQAGSYPSQADSAGNGGDKTIIGQVIPGNQREDNADLHRDIRLTYSKPQADIAEHGGLVQSRPWEVDSPEELIFQTNEAPIESKGSVSGQVARRTDRQNRIPVSQDIHLVHKDLGRKETANEAKPSRLEIYGPEELTFRTGEESTGPKGTQNRGRTPYEERQSGRQQLNSSEGHPMASAHAEQCEEGRQTVLSRPDEMHTVSPKTEVASAREIRTIPALTTRKSATPQEEIPGQSIGGLENLLTYREEGPKGGETQDGQNNLTSATRHILSVSPLQANGQLPFTSDTLLIRRTNAGEAAQPAAHEPDTQNRENLALWIDKESKQTTDPAVHAAVRGNDHIGQARPTSVQTAEKQIPPASRVDSAEDGRDKNVSDQVIHGNQRQDIAGFHRDIRLTHSKPQADAVEHGSLGQSSYWEAASLEELTFQKNEDPMESQGSVPGQMVRGTDRQNSTPVNQEIRLVHKDLGRKEKTSEAQSARLETYGPEELTFRADEDSTRRKNMQNRGRAAHEERWPGNGAQEHPVASKHAGLRAGANQAILSRPDAIQTVSQIIERASVRESRTISALTTGKSAGGPKDLPTYREEGPKGGEGQAIQNNMPSAARSTSAPQLQANGQPPIISVMPLTRLTTAEETEQARQTRHMTYDLPPEELTHRAEGEDRDAREAAGRNRNDPVTQGTERPGGEYHTGTMQVLYRSGKGMQNFGPMTETRTARVIRTIPPMRQSESPAILRESLEKAKQRETRSQVQGVLNASGLYSDWTLLELSHRTEQTPDGVNQSGTAQPQQNLRSAAAQSKTATRMLLPGTLAQTNDAGIPMRRRTGGVQTAFRLLSTAQRRMGTRSTLESTSQESPVPPEHHSRTLAFGENESSMLDSIPQREDLTYAAEPGKIMRGRDSFSHAGARTNGVVSWNAPSTEKAQAQKSTAAPWPEQVELSYLPDQQTSEQAQRTPESAASMDSEYVRSLPAWAQNFLKGGSAGTESTTANAPMGVARNISALPGAGSGQEQISWTAPQVQTRPAEITYKQKEEPQSNAAQAAQMSDSELRRTADKVYQIIEERIRRERRRLGL